MTSSPPESPADPPADPDDWTDEQWLAWLEATDPIHDVPDTGPRLAAWRTHPIGSALGAAILGAHEAIYGRIDHEVAIVQEAAGDPPDEDLHDLRLDPDHPERSEVIVRRPPTPEV
jgi:hypothetical protein